MATDKADNDMDSDIDPSTGLPYHAELGETGPEEKAAIKYGLQQAKANKVIEDCNLARYVIQRGGNGLFTIMRRVDESCADYDEDTPFEEYYDNVCVCASAFIALHIAQAIEKSYPDGNMV